MKTQHQPHHWVAVALVLAALLLTLSEAQGQQSGAAAQFEGRPAMAGAQGGQGAQAGVPQGGLGVQGNEMAERSMQLRREVAPAPDESLAKDQRSAKKKAVRAAKRTISRARHGNAPVDTQTR